MLICLFVGSAIIFVICVSILGQLFIPKLRYEKNRRSSIIKSGQWAAAAATAAVAEVAEINEVVDHVDHVDARSQVSGEII
jgi:hypothetical protein